ncbi:Na/Pi cotransporter family protein [uncultured Megasphaera sp.]|uniref:Na/Pi cotransporter family protein n=1 Tax=uncultured Megasphaera sp. TaxID=165188 RepID=UPI002659CE5B|nr:Na/Pi cotransporter family protein [uncultured Megasphaera sp.]
MDPSLKIFFGLIGGLALFLYGMNGMSDSLQKVAGERMKKILGMLTKNPVLGAIAGMLVTAVLQSSSATTVMVIGFVSAGLMTLPQGISVIFGANIGTTMTAQLLAFKLSDYIYPIIFIGFIMNFVSKQERLKNIGLVIFNFGLLFEGIEIMGNVMKPLAGSPIFVDLMAQVSHIPVLGLLVGMGMTLVVQSSSATIAVLQNFASQPGPDGGSVIGLLGAIPILLGDNIGTTITALLACIGQSKNAQRTAVAHSVFNISGSMVFLCIIPFFAQFVMWISPQGPELDVISRQIANAHTTFNIVCTLVWLPLIHVMVKIVRFIIRGDDTVAVSTYMPRYLDNNMLGQPAAAMYLVSQELEHLAGLTSSMLEKLRNVVSGKGGSEEDQGFVMDQEGVKSLQDRIALYITRLFSQGSLTEQQAEQTAGLLFVSNHIDHIADRSGEIRDFVKNVDAGSSDLSDKAKAELDKCLQISQNMFAQSVQAVKEGDKTAAQHVNAEKHELHELQKECYREHFERVQDNECSPDLTTDYAAVLYSLDRMADNCVGIAEEAMGHAAFINLDKPEKEGDKS